MRRFQLAGGSAAACVALFHHRHQSRSEASSNESPPLFRFGVIADIQYCDCKPATNFCGSETRNYRGGLAQTERAVEFWNSLNNLAFVAQLGDLIDGQNAGTYGQGLDFDSPQSAPAMERVRGILARCKAPIYHAIGNHEL